MKEGQTKALGNKPLVSRYVQNSGVATCQDANLLLVYSKKPGDVSNKRQQKRFTQGLNLKRILETGPYCTSAPVSPLCRILHGCSTVFICKREELS